MKRAHHGGPRRLLIGGSEPRDRASFVAGGGRPRRACVRRKLLKKTRGGSGAAWGVVAGDTRGGRVVEDVAPLREGCCPREERPLVQDRRQPPPSVDDLWKERMKRAREIICTDHDKRGTGGEQTSRRGTTWGETLCTQQTVTAI